VGLWSATFESLGKCQKRAIERGLANLSQRLGVPVMHAVRRHVADARMPVLRVVPSEEGPAVGPRILDATEPRREIRHAATLVEAVGMLTAPLMACFDVAEARQLHQLLDRS
jgi:hypothetical protein